MLNPAEQERLEQLENETAKLQNKIAMQQILISGLLHSFFRNEASNQSAFFDILSEELNKLPLGSVKQQEFSHHIQVLIDRYR